ncbi:MAG: hypothetical protein H6610_09945 [Ignavibacteriales bacterium]|nr:hypothetical protein [Ignavibacteriales bacterium]MCB9219764.1 hypothetical protein [Ignavibacteriales bacterium]MCB9260025.1 hypothetical protein [Ignavibacteriales bacterium]
MGDLIYGNVKKIIDDCTFEITVTQRSRNNYFDYLNNEKVKLISCDSPNEIQENQFQIEDLEKSEIVMVKFSVKSRQNDGSLLGDLKIV